MKAKIPYLTARPGAKGRTRYFWQPSKVLRGAGWRLTQLSDDLGDAITQARALNDQVAAWRAGDGTSPSGRPAKRQDARKLPAGSIAALRHDYERSRFWAKLSDASKRDYKRHLDQIETWAGDAPAAAISAPLVERYYQSETKRRGPAAAAATVRVLRWLLGVGIKLGYVSTNAAAEPDLDVQKRGESRLWEPEDIDARLEAEASREGTIQSATHLLVNDRTARPWTEDAFKKASAEVRAAAAKNHPACGDLWFMELRHSAITRLHETGVDALDIAAISGHAASSVTALLDKHYLICSAKQAEGAFQRRLAAEGAPE